MIIGFTRAADRDLLAIGDHLRPTDPELAARLVNELLDRCWSLSTLAKRFPVAKRRGRRTIHKITHGNYLIFYWVLPERVEIGRVLHAKRNWSVIV